MDPFMRDWGLLERVCGEWTRMQNEYGFPRRASREQLEAIWAEILAGRFPAIGELFFHMMSAEGLIARLRRCFWSLQPWERRHYSFEEVLPSVLLRLGWQVVRNACNWLRNRGSHEHWAPWNDDNLREELRRAIEDLWRGEGQRDQPLPSNI